MRSVIAAACMALMVLCSLIVSADTKGTETIRKEEGLTTVTFIPTVLANLQGQTHYGGR